MQTEIVGVKIDVLLDTGASCNVLRNTMFDKLKNKYSSIKLDVCGAEHTRLRLFSESETKINGKFTIQLPLENQLYEVETLVVKDLPVDLILGQKFFCFCFLILTVV